MAAKITDKDRIDFLQRRVGLRTSNYGGTWWMRFVLSPLTGGGPLRSRIVKAPTLRKMADAAIRAERKGKK